MNRSLTFALTAMLVLPVIWMVDASATQIIPMSTRELGTQSTLVVQGTVTSTRSFWNERRTKIFTETTVEVTSAHKGQELHEVRVLQIGGSVDGVRTTVHGALEWSRGESVLLFLEPYFAGGYAVSGFSQGKFLVETDPTTGLQVVRRPALDGVEFPQAADAQTKAPIARMPLESFLERALGRE